MEIFVCAERFRRRSNKERRRIQHKAAQAASAMEKSAAAKWHSLQRQHVSSQRVTAMELCSGIADWASGRRSVYLIFTDCRIALSANSAARGNRAQ